MLMLSSLRAAMLTKARDEVGPEVAGSLSQNLNPLLESYIDAFLDSAKATLSSFKVVGASVSGGAAPPGGPVSGAVLSIPPGSPVFKPAASFSLFRPPRFTATMPDGSVHTGKYTPWLRGLTSVICPLADDALDDWLRTWNVSGETCVVGGVAGWVPSSPPSPGPWAGGTITPIPLVGGTAQAPAVKLKAIRSTTEAKGCATIAHIEIDEDGGTVASPVFNDAGKGIELGRGLNAAFEYLMEKVAAVELVDRSGSGGSGVAAPGGILTGTIAELTLAVS